MEVKRLLFVCEHNSARSQMAEALLKKLAGRRFEVESAGFEPGILNPLAVRAMADMGIDISKNTTKRVFDLYRQGKLYTYVVTVCDETAAGKCPIFPVLLKQSTGRFRIRQALQARMRKNWKTPSMCAMPSEKRLRIGWRRWIDDEICVRYDVKNFDGS